LLYCSQLETEPLDGKWEGGEHNFMVDVEVVSVLFVDVDFHAGELLLHFSGDDKGIGILDDIVIFLPV
jgi:hypothetical protein